VTIGKLKVLFLLSALLLAGCGTTGEIKGRFIGSDGAGIPGADVVCWKRGRFMELPLRVAETKTDQEGRFSVIVSKRVHSIQARTPDTFDKMRHGTVTLWGAPSQEVIIREEPIQLPETTRGK
jgi:predicted small secreted protein